MPPISLLIKPASSLCNLRCQYCFYHSLSKNRRIASYGLMPETILEQIVRRAFEESDTLVTFAFQGGEPTVRGLPFYERLICFVEQYNQKHIPVQYALQTNGLLIDEQWARFLAKHRFLVGLSLDGYKEMHDSLRVDSNGQGSYKAVLQAASLMQKHQVAFNILTVVSNRLARHAEKIYRFYERQGFNYLQFIPCLAPLGADPADDPYAVSPERYADFLLRLFDLWYADIVQGKEVSIRLFDNWVRMAAGERPEQCGLSGVCTCQLVIESDGGVYPCDFYVTDEWRIGQIQTDRLTDMMKSEIAERFVTQSQYVPDSCRSCSWYPICRNGCRRDRLILEDLSIPGQNRFCTANQAFFSQVYPRLAHLARFWKQMQQRASLSPPVRHNQSGGERN